MSNTTYPCLAVAEAVLDVLAQSGLNEEDRVCVLKIAQTLATEPLIKSAAYGHLMHPSTAAADCAGSVV